MHSFSSGKTQSSAYPSTDRLQSISWLIQFIFVSAPISCLHSWFLSKHPVGKFKTCLSFSLPPLVVSSVNHFKPELHHSTTFSSCIWLNHCHVCHWWSLCFVHMGVFAADLLALSFSCIYIEGKRGVLRLPLAFPVTQAQGGLKTESNPMLCKQTDKCFFASSDLNESWVSFLFIHHVNVTHACIWYLYPDRKGEPCLCPEG